jgi:nucleotide-binding universal stress UspA family protein
LEDNVKALLTTDGSETSQSIVPTAKRLCELVPGIELHMFTVLDPRSVHGTQASPVGDPKGAAAGTMVVRVPPPRVVESRGEADERLHRDALASLSVLAQDAFPGVDVRCDAVWANDPAAAIVKRANEIDADVIVMATHGRSGLSHLLAGSVAESVIRKSGRPVLVRCPDPKL